jgi:A/G-specific adenine glycosylase
MKYQTIEPVELLQTIPQPLLKWYDKSKRALPWREHPTAYRVWVSEIMLQQTRVEAVKPYFERFMGRLPDVAELAAADEETLLKLWEGLGYYNRVRNLQKAAVRIMEEYGGHIPQEYEELMQLPGIGSYTAGAISSIAYGKRKPAVDGNVLRVLARIRRDDRLISDGKVKGAVERELQEIMPEDRPGDFNQAMMEIGACICVPNGAPHCEECPLAGMCMAHRDGVEMEYPRKAAAKKRSIEEKTILVIQDAERTVIRKRDSRGLLAGMYEFPSLPGFCTAEEVVGYLSENGLKTLRIQPLEEAKHIFTHREWHMRGYLVRVDELEPTVPCQGTEDWIYIQPEETRASYPIPAAFGAYTRILSMKLGKDNFKEEQS